MAWQPTVRSKEQKDLSNMTQQLKKYQDDEPITERMTATAEKAREVKQWKSQSKTDRKTKASRLSRPVAGRGFGNQKNTCYLLTREQWIMSPTKADGMPYFPLFAGKDAKFENAKALPCVETVVNGKITEQKD